LLLQQHHPGALTVLAFLDVDNPSILFESLFLRLVNVRNFFCQGAGLIAFCLVVVCRDAYGYRYREG
jgi:hypothetical protein